MDAHIKQIVDNEICKALDRKGLRFDDPVRNQLLACAEIGNGYTPDIRFWTESGELVSSDEAIEQQLKVRHLHAASHLVYLATIPTNYARTF